MPVCVTNRSKSPPYVPSAARIFSIPIGETEKKLAGCFRLSALFHEKGQSYFGSSAFKGRNCFPHDYAGVDRARPGQGEWPRRPESRSLGGKCERCRAP